MKKMFLISALTLSLGALADKKEPVVHDVHHDTDHHESVESERAPIPNPDFS